MSHDTDGTTDERTTRVPVSRRGTVAALLGLSALGGRVTAATPSGGPPVFDAGRYLERTAEGDGPGEIDFTGPAEWSNASEYTNEVTGAAATVAGGEHNAARIVQPDLSGPTVGGGVRNEAKGWAPTVSGGKSNRARGDGATVGGGMSNVATGLWSTVGGGEGCDATGRDSTVAGGTANVAAGDSATVAGGKGNTSSGEDSTVAGGRNHDAAGDGATVGGGINNVASGRRATVPGGAGNVADGDYSFAAGREARTNGNDGAVVIADSSPTEIEAQGEDELRSQLPVFAPSFNTTSAQTAKTDVEPVDPERLLAGVRDLSISAWRFEHGDDRRHVGPMAGDFQDAFDLDGDAASIPSVDADGVALGAIQALADRDEDRADRLAELATENAALRTELATVRRRLDALEAGQREVAAETE